MCLKIWKPHISLSIFDLQLHEVLAIKWKCFGETEAPQKVEVTPGETETPQKVEVTPESIR